MDWLLPRADDPPRTQLDRGLRLLIWVSVLGLAAYAAYALLNLNQPDFTHDGPGDLSHAQLVDLGTIPQPEQSLVKDKMGQYESIRAATVPESTGSGLIVYYVVKPDGSVYNALAIDQATHAVTSEAARLKPTGAWRWIGQFKSQADWIAGVWQPRPACSPSVAGHRGALFAPERRSARRKMTPGTRCAAIRGSSPRR